MPQPLPAELIEIIDDLRAGTHTEPEVTELDRRRWRLSVSNERVYMEVDFRRAQRERVVWLRSALIVDGQRKPVARNPEHFYRIFKDPDTEGGPPAEPDPLLPEASPDTLPAIIRAVYVKLIKGIGAEHVRVGNLGGRWVLSVDGERGSLQLHFRRYGRKYGPDGSRWIHAVIDGIDRSAEVKGDLDQAMALFTAPGNGPDQPDTVGDPAGGTGYGSVGVRQHSVMRN